MTTETITSTRSTDTRSTGTRSTGTGPENSGKTSPGSTSAGPDRPAGAPRTPAGERALRRRRARVAGRRRPASGVLPSSSRTSAVVRADAGDQVAERDFTLGRWARLVATVSLVLAAVAVAVFLLSGSASSRLTDVTVQPGDSLWSIAQRAEPGADPRAVVEQIRELNSLSEGDAVVTGAVLKVPTSTG